MIKNVTQKAGIGIFVISLQVELILTLKNKEYEKENFHRFSSLTACIVSL